jgi:hypothetical protein
VVGIVDRLEGRRQSFERLPYPVPGDPVVEQLGGVLVGANRAVAIPSVAEEYREPNLGRAFSKWYSQRWQSLPESLPFGTWIFREYRNQVVEQYRDDVRLCIYVMDLLSLPAPRVKIEDASDAGWGDVDQNRGGAGWQAANSMDLLPRVCTR